MANGAGATGLAGPVGVDSFNDEQLVRSLAQNWWALVIRGAAGVLFGIGALVWPPAAVAALVLFFGAYALVDGIFNIAEGCSTITVPLKAVSWGKRASEKAQVLRESRRSPRSRP